MSVLEEKRPDSLPASGLPADVAVSVEHLGKCYRIFAAPQDRLKQALFHGRRRFFREFWALHDVSFQVRRGETVGIMGRNGCGKSTLLQLICGTLTPTAGRSAVNGRVAALLELGAGFNPEFSGRDNVFTSAAVMGLSQTEIAARFDDIVAFSELGEFIERPVKTYSSGMYVRLAFAVAISVEPDILVVDEALSVGDEAFQRKCFARIRAIQHRGGTILFVSHGSGTIIDLCNRALLLDQGELLVGGQPKLVVAKYHKLIYAPAAQHAAIREEIKKGSSAIRVDDDGGGNKSAPPLPAGKAAAVRARPLPTETSSAFFDPGMQPKSTVVYHSNGAIIHNPQITTPDGTVVNVLVPHEEYVICYDVEFTQPSLRVRWGTLIKNILGTELGGMNTEIQEYVPEGTRGALAFRFRCQLVPGVYFANVGLMGVVDGRETYLHRVEDALMFRVMYGENRSLVGPVDFFLDAELAVAAADAAPEKGGQSLFPAKGDWPPFSAPKADASKVA